MIDIEQEYRDQLEAASKEMALDVDFEVLSHYFVEAGWTRVTIDRFTDNYHAIDILEWLKDNVKPDSCMGRGRTFLFKDAKQATLFILRWGGEL